MTIDQVIKRLEEAKATLPLGGNTVVSTPDGLEFLRVLFAPGDRWVTVTAHDEHGHHSKWLAAEADYMEAHKRKGQS